MTDYRFYDCIYYRKGENHCAKNLYQFDCRLCMFYKSNVKLTFTTEEVEE